MHSELTLSKTLLNILAQLYYSLINFIFYLPCGGENCFRKRCMNFAGSAEGEQVLDVCCGTGTLTSLIAHRVGLNGQVIGVDITESALEIARTKTQNLSVTLLRVNAENLPFDSSRFHKCFISFGLHHMPRQARQNTLKEIHRTLTAAGSLFVVDYNLSKRALARLITRALAKLDESEEAYRMLMNSSLLKEIEQAGLEVRRQESLCKGMVQLVEAVNT